MADNEFGDIIRDVQSSLDKPSVELELYGALTGAEANIARLANGIKTFEAIVKKAQERLKELRAAQGAEIDALMPLVQSCGAEGVKKIALPSGAQLTISKRRGNLEIRDEAAAIGWLIDNAPDCIRVKEEVAKNEVKKLIAEGRDVPGCEIVCEPQYSARLQLTTGEKVGFEVEEAESRALPEADSGEVFETM